MKAISFDGGVNQGDVFLSLSANAGKQLVKRAKELKKAFDAVKPIEMLATSDMPADFKVRYPTNAEAAFEMNHVKYLFELTQFAQRITMVPWEGRSFQFTFTDLLTNTGARA